jgi:hypothetical protein
MGHGAAYEFGVTEVYAVEVAEGYGRLRDIPYMR